MSGIPVGPARRGPRQALLSIVLWQSALIYKYLFLKEKYFSFGDDPSASLIYNPRCPGRAATASGQSRTRFGCRRFPAGRPVKRETGAVAGLSFQDWGDGGSRHSLLTPHFCVQSLCCPRNGKRSASSPLDALPRHPATVSLGYGKAARQRSRARRPACNAVVEVPRGGGGPGIGVPFPPPQHFLGLFLRAAGAPDGK